MPPRVRRKLSVVVVVGCAVLATAGVAAAGNGGIAPEPAHSPNAHHINEAYWLVAAFAIGIFVLVEGLLVYFIIRYRGRDRTVEGAQVHGNTRLELIWTAIPIGIIAVLFGFVFSQLPDITGPPSANASDRLHIKIDAHQFYWQFTYPNGAISIDDLHLPVGRVVEFDITAQDVIHSWWIPQLGGKTDAIPGRTNTTWYKPEAEGVYKGQCAELCGLYHERMLARAIVTSQAEYEQWIGKAARTQLGKAEWEGVCAKCHGLQGEGDYGPPLSTNSILTQPAGLEEVVRNGRGRMPAVGSNWTKEQFKALEAYVSKNVYKGTTSGG
jgi:cytochrome c oxidase subunit 2